MSVSRDKYERAKEAARAWHNELIKLQDEQQKYTHLEEENKSLAQTIRELKRELSDRDKAASETEQKYKDKIASLERDRLLFEGRIQQLEEARRDLQERYNELKQDFREHQKWTRTMGKE